MPGGDGRMDGLPFAPEIPGPILTFPERTVTHFPERTVTHFPERTVTHQTCDMVKAKHTSGARSGYVVEAAGAGCNAAVIMHAAKEGG